MLFKSAIAKFEDFRFVAGKLDIRSSLGRHALPETKWMTDPAEIKNQLWRLQALVETVRDPKDPKAVNSLLGELSHVKDIRRTIDRIGNGETPDDIELYEVKAFAISCGIIAGLLGRLEIQVIRIPDLDPVIHILDPDGNRIAHFYIYDSYSADLAEARRGLKSATEAEKELLFARSTELENLVREKLAARLRPYTETMAAALDGVCDLDILLAKARLVCDLGLGKPEITFNETYFNGLFNPATAQELRAKGKRFQAVDVTLPDGPTLITGANMGGKTVVLRSVALSQLLCQFGFFVPATEARIAPVEDVILMSEAQDAGGGLSSFGSEIVRLNGLIKRIREGEKLLVLIDEPARTTNPDEGKALVAALLDFLSEYKVRSLVTSHFSGIGARVRRLRVKGFTGKDPEVTIDDIQDYMDYSLVEDAEDKEPREALRVARMLGMDIRVRQRAEYYMNNKEKK